MEQTNRRELSTRRQAWPSAIARTLANAGITPNQVSVASILFAMLSAWAFWRIVQPSEHRSAWAIVAAAGIQLRLLCNMLDGLLAIEGGLRSKTGDLYNEIPDRIADILILVGAGVAMRDSGNGLAVGVAAALLAVLTAYVRLLGGSLALKQDFGGPMAKQHRMFVLTVGALAAAIEHVVAGSMYALLVALWIIVVGSVLTLLRRTRRIARELQAR